MKIKAFVLFSCFCLFPASATQASTTVKHAAASSAPKAIEFRPVFKELVQKALDRKLPQKFTSDSFDISKYGTTEQIIHKVYLVVEQYPSVWSKIVRMVCRKQGIFGIQDRPLHELIPVGLSRILMAEGVDIRDILTRKSLSPTGMINEVFFKVLNKAVSCQEDTLLSSVAWLFLRYYRMFPEKKAILGEENEENSSIRVREDTKAENSDEEFEFRPQFKKLVQEALNKRLNNLVSMSAPARELNEMEQGILKKFPLYHSKSNPWPWVTILGEECRERNIFGPYLIKYEQLIPIALSRILNAEGADINDLMFGRRNASWDNSSKSVSHIFSKILNKHMNVDSYQIQSSVLWLVLRYHETFQDKHELMLEDCREELELLFGSKKSEPLPLGLMDKEKEGQEKGNVVSDNSSNSSFRVDMTSTEEPAVSSPKKIEFRPDFKKLVQAALNCRLHILVTKDSLRISTSKPTDQIIYDTYLTFKSCDNVWNKTIEKVCQEGGILGGKVMHVDELIDVGLTRILKAEGVDIKDIISGYNLSNDDKISQVYSKVLDKAVESNSTDKLISSAAWLFLEYFRLFPEKKALLCEERAEQSKGQLINNQQLRQSFNVHSAGTNIQHGPRRVTTEVGFNLFVPARKVYPTAAKPTTTTSSTLSEKSQQNSSMTVVPQQQQHAPLVTTKTSSIYPSLDTFIKCFQAVNINEYFESNAKLPGVTTAHEVLKVHCYKVKRVNQLGWKDSWGKIFKILKAKGYFDDIKTHEEAVKGIKPGLSALCWFLFGDKGPEVWSSNRTRNALGKVVKPLLYKYGEDFNNIDRMLPLIVFILISYNIGKTETDSIYQEFVKSPPNNFTLPKISNSVKKAKRKRDRTTADDYSSYAEEELIAGQHTHEYLSETYSHITKKPRTDIPGPPVLPFSFPPAPPLPFPFGNAAAFPHFPLPASLIVPTPQQESVEDPMRWATLNISAISEFQFSPNYSLARFQDNGITKTTNNNNT